VALSLGGNQGAPEAVEDHLRRALEGLHRALGPLTVASLYRTAPIGAGGTVAQPDYLNTAALAHTDMEPEAILALAKALEWEAGRRRGERFGPRPLDVDLLLWGDRVSKAPELTLPHPRLAERRFMLEPLAEIAPGLPVPPEGTTVAELLARLEEEGGAGQEVVEVGWSRPIELG
jgi:2-amino-4-hydroxy-6-hydroxymethyldihydropteridine diphosphokinase